MLYELFSWLEMNYDLPGSGVFRFITFRAALAAILAMLMGTIVGKHIINLLRRKQIGETIRAVGPESHQSKKGTPTMGGLIILVSILLPCLLVARLDNIYVLVMMGATLWMGLIGLADDYIKVFLKDKQGLRSGSKVLGQVGLGILVAAALFFHPDVQDVALRTNLPVTKHLFDYSQLAWGPISSWLVYFGVIVLIVTAVTNSVNLTDGIDGLAAGVSAITGTGLGILAYMSGNIKTAAYLNILYVPMSGEVVVFLAALVGACIGFLWYNTYPAQVFMGDTGSLALGGAIASSAIIIKMELLLPILCGIFFVESLSVILQVSYFKYTKKKYGEGRRIFRMSPLHHHFELGGIAEPKIVTRFWIVAILLVLVAVALLKLR
ncbi:MAG: phospho-N-acetylmuramoyl-pentapeptide-transferase [Bacteroidetes bacterium]|nr:phospho-N-acetylmuramoyl-pentapeptide-transferase [Bacteroidota bacterium]